MTSLLAKIRNTNFLKKIIHFFVGFITYPGIAIFSKIKIEGTEQLKNLPKANVLFVCNHQTYFMDVITLFHIFSAVKWKKINRLGIPYYLLNCDTNVNYVGAETTMKTNMMTRVFLLAGGLTVRRTWNKTSNEGRSGLDPSDTRKIERALMRNRIITFPQGTTTPFAPARKGTALIIKHHKPIVIPVVLNGFSQAFSKKGISLKKAGTRLTVRFKAPIKINYDASAEEITEQIMEAIEQRKQFTSEIQKY
jgi:1-acyl-sn-glycerol-3-phosphate acyltransferase